MTDVYIACLHDDRAYVEPMARQLESVGYVVWWDASSSVAEANLEVSRREMLAARAVVVVWSPASASSPMIAIDASAAVKRGVLVNVRTPEIGPSEIPQPFDNLLSCRTDDEAAIYSALRNLGLIPRYAPEVTGASLHDRFWAEVEMSEHAEDFELYLKEFPEGPHIAFARLEIARLRTEKAVRSDIGRTRQYPSLLVDSLGRLLRRVPVRWPSLSKTIARLAISSVAVLGVGSTVVYLTALIALNDLEVAASSGSGASLMEDVDKGGANAIAGHAAPLISGNRLHNHVLTTAHDGTVRLTHTVPATRLEAATLPRLISALNDRLWRPYGAPVAQRALRLAAQVLPLHIPQSRKGQRGRIFRDCPDCPEMIEIEPGIFFMGSPLTELQRDWDEGPRQLITISRPIAVGRFEVTFAEWDACVATGGCSHIPRDEGWGREHRPVTDVSWDDAKTFVSWISQRTGKTYRLLTEAEWEYVARAGATSRYSWGEDIGKGNANCSGCGSQWDGNQTAPAGSFQPNAFGLHDLHGNVWEWVEDCLSEDLSGQPGDGAARQQTEGACSSRVVRGGSWGYNPRVSRAAFRFKGTPSDRTSSLGFRLARTITP